MKAFQFPLQAVRTLRERQEQTALLQYAQAIRARREAEQALANAAHALDQSCRSWQDRLQQAAAAEELDQLRRHCETTLAHQQACAQHLAQSQRNVESAWSTLVQTRRQRQSVEHLHDKMQAEYRRHCDRIEQKQIDEMGQRSSSLTAVSAIEHPWN